MNHAPPKTHFLERPSSKTTKCGRSRDMKVPMTDDMEKVTCSTCIAPNKPFVVAGRAR